MDEATNEITRKFKKFDKAYFSMTPEQQYEYVAELLKSLSPKNSLEEEK